MIIKLIIIVYDKDEEFNYYLVIVMIIYKGFLNKSWLWIKLIVVILFVNENIYI